MTEEIKHIHEINRIINQKRINCPDCYNSCGNSEAYYSKMYSCQCSTGWTNCPTCSGTGKTPTNDQIYHEIKEYLKNEGLDKAT